MTEPVRERVEQIDESAWTTIDDYPDSGEAQIAETTLDGRRLIVRRVRTLASRPSCSRPGSTTRSSPTASSRSRWSRPSTASTPSSSSCIRDLKDQALAHFPSGQFNANSAWTVIAALAHNLLRWTELLGLPGSSVRAARTLRRRLLSLPGRLTHHAGRWTLHLPARWPWQHDFVEALEPDRALPAAA